MTKPSGDRDSGQWTKGERGIIALLLLYLLSAERHLLSCLLRGQTASLRGRGVPGYPLIGNNETWNDLDDALAMPSTSGDLRIPPNIDPEGQYNVPLDLFPDIFLHEVDQLRDQLPAIQDPMEIIDADNAAAAEADLDMWLAVAEVASLPRQIERDEANLMVTRPQVPSSVAESGVAPSSSVDDVAAGAPQHPPPQAPVPETVAPDAPAPDVVGILAGVLPQQIEDEDEAHAEAQVEVEVAADAPAPDVVGILAGVRPQQIEVEDEAHAEAQVEVEVEVEAFPPRMLDLISGVARLPQFATPNMVSPAGDLESNLEDRVPVDHLEAGDSSADLEAKINMEDDVENLEVEEPRAKDMQ